MTNASGVDSTLVRCRPSYLVPDGSEGIISEAKFGVLGELGGERERNLLYVALSEQMDPNSSQTV